MFVVKVIFFSKQAIHPYIHVSKLIIKSQLSYFIRNYSTLVVPSRQKVLIIGKPPPFHPDFCMRQQCIITENKL